MKCWIVMPARDEERTIGEVIEGLHREGWKDIIVVDDGSRDRTAEIARAKGAVVVSHERNLGLGAALRTGLREALRRGADCAVTFDADGQHDPREVRKMVEAIDGADLIIGSRQFVNVPLNKRFGNFVLNLITRLMGGPLLDSQSGMRAFNRRALETIRIRSDRYEVSSEIVINACRSGLRIKEVPVKCYFTDYSKARGTTIASGIRIFLRLIKLRAIYG